MILQYSHKLACIMWFNSIHIQKQRACIISEPIQINLPICGFADSWMTKASETPTYNQNKVRKVIS